VGARRARVVCQLSDYGDASVNGELVSSADFNISQWTEAEVEAILQHLTNQNALMLEILKRVEGLEKSRDQVN